MKNPALESMAIVLGQAFLTLEVYAGKRPVVYDSLRFENNVLHYEGTRYNLALRLLTEKIAQIDVTAQGKTMVYNLAPFYAERMFSDLVIASVPDKEALMAGIAVRNQAKLIQPAIHVA